MSSRHTFTVYSIQKHKDMGHGGIGLSEPMADGWEARVAAKREAQRIENEEYKKRVAAGEVITKRYFSKSEARAQRIAADIVEKQVVAAAADNIPAPVYAIRGTRRLVSDELANSKILSMPSKELVAQQRQPFQLHLDPNTGNTIFAVGSSKRGKSTAIMHIYDQYYADRQFVSTLWSANPQAAPYRGHRKLIKAVWGNGKDGERLIKEQKKINVSTNNHYKFLNVFDDVLHMKGSRLMDNLIMTYRNSKMSTIVSMQYSNNLQKCARANINHVLLFGMNTDEAIEVMIKTYLKGYLCKVGITKIADQINWYKAVTDDHGFIYTMPQDGTVTLHKIRVA